MVGVDFTDNYIIQSGKYYFLDETANYPEKDGKMSSSKKSKLRSVQECLQETYQILSKTKVEKFGLEEDIQSLRSIIRGLLDWCETSITIPKHQGDTNFVVHDEGKDADVITVCLPIESKSNPIFIETTRTKKLKITNKQGICTHNLRIHCKSCGLEIQK